MRKYILVFAPPGVKLGDAADRLAEKLNAEAVDIEKEIKSDPQTERALEDIKATFTRPINMETVTHNLPRTKISKLWKDAVARCLKKLEESNKPIKIMSGHLIYWSGKRNEFYSVIDPDDLHPNTHPQRRLKPDCILLLVDDIYDMYERLPVLYSPDKVDSFMRKLERDMNIDVSSLSKEQLSSLTMGWEIRNLLHLLSWRHLEPIIAENLALQLKARFLVWPIKQLIESIKSWLEDSQTTSIYLSHPITDPRGERNESGEWPEFTNEINQLQEILSKQGITLVMPTGIDELRFQVRKRQYTGYLEDRWPPMVEDETKLLYTQPDNAKDINYNTLLLPKYWNFQGHKLLLLENKKYGKTLKSEINAFLQVLVREIEAQISSRDFLFIYHTDGLMVFRPYYARKPRPAFSGGVDAEVSLWEDIVQLKGQKRVAFVHFERDVESMLCAKKDKIFAEFVDTVWGLLNKELCIEKNTVENMVRNKGNIREVESILNRANIAQRDRLRLKKAVSANWKKWKIELLKKYLTNVIDVEEASIGVWVFRDFDSVKAEASKIASFLKNGSPTGNNWEDQIENLFPDNSIDRRVGKLPSESAG